MSTKCRERLSIMVKSNNGFKILLKVLLTIIVLFILIFTSVLLFGLFAYSVVSEEKSDFMFERYSKELSEQLTDNIDTTKEIKNVLKKMNIENAYTKK